MGSCKNVLPLVIIFPGFIGVLFMFLLFKQPEFWPISFFCFLSGLIIVVGIYSIRIVVKDDRIIYKILFFYKKEKIFFSDISELKLLIGLDDKSRGKGFIRFNIYNEKLEELLSINGKIFDRRDLSILANLINKKVPNIKNDKLMKALIEENFSLINKSLWRKLWQIAVFIFIVSLFSALLKAFL